MQRDPHSDLMEQIRKGNCLRKVNAESDALKCKNPAVGKPVDELQKALQNRICKLTISDSENDEYSSDSDEWDD